MADNVAITAGSGTSIAADDVGGNLHQRVKVTWGPDGTGNDTDTASGKPLPVQLRSSTGTALSFGSGASDTGTPRVTIDTGQLAALSTTSATMSAGYQLVGLPSDQVKIPVQGNTAHDAADADKPIKVGRKATTSLSALTLVANADVTDTFAGIDGVAITRPHTNLEDIVSGNASNTDGTSTQCIAAAAAGIKQYITSVILTNTSASNIYVEIKDGTTVKVTLPLPANSGCIFNPPVPIPGTAATAWNFDPSASATTVYCSMIGFKSKV